MFLASFLLGRPVEEADGGSDCLSPGLLDVRNWFWELSGVVVANPRVLVLAMQAAGLANRLMYRRLAAADLHVARAVVGILVISGLDMVCWNSIQWTGIQLSMTRYKSKVWRDLKAST